VLDELSATRRCHLRDTSRITRTIVDNDGMSRFEACEQLVEALWMIHGRNHDGCRCVVCGGDRWCGLGETAVEHQSPCREVNRALQRNTCVTGVDQTSD
jgi:hypothetical protein